MDRRIRQLAEQVDAHHISRREFVRRTALITGGTAVGLGVLELDGARPGRPRCASGSSRASSPAATTSWPSRSRRGRRSGRSQVEMDWATFGDREQKFVAAIEAGNPPDLAEMNYQGPMRYRPALRDVTKLAKDLAARAGRPAALRRARRRRSTASTPASPRLVFGGGLLHPQGHHGGQGPQDAEGLRPRRPRVRQEVPGSVQGPLGLRPDAEPLATTATASCRTSCGTTAAAPGTRTASPRWAPPILKQNMAALQFAVDTIQKHKIQPPGVMAWTDVSNNEAYMAGKLVSTNNGASLYYAMVARKHPLAEKTQVHPDAGRAGRVASSPPVRYNWGIFKASQERRAGRGPDPLGRGREALRGVHERVRRPGRPRLQERAPSNPYWKTRPELRGHAAEHPARRVDRLSRARSRRRPSRCRPSTSCATWRAGWWSGGLSPEAALKEAHERVEEIYRIRSRA